MRKEKKMDTTPLIRMAQRMNSLPPYLFGMIHDLKERKLNAGHDVIDLGMGNPTDPPPSSVIRKLRDCAGAPQAHRYPMAGGTASLRRQIAAMYQHDYDVAIDKDRETICTIGSKEGLSHLCLAMIDHGDTVLVPAPAFPIHIYGAVIAGGNVIRFKLGDEDRMLKRITNLCTKLSPPPKLLILNYPHNPTGETVSLAFFTDIVRLAKQSGLLVIHDFAYAKITFDGYVAPSFLQAPGALDVGVEFGSFSKSYNMAGWRIGYCAGNSELIAALARIKGYFDYGVFSPIHMAGETALRDCNEDISRQAAIYRKRRDLVCAGLHRMG
jgi:alanine-synthesizing transaminase